MMSGLSKNIKKMFKFQMLAIVSLSVGCVSNSPGNTLNERTNELTQQNMAAEETTKTSEAVLEEKTELTAEILYEIMLAEIALQRGDIRTATRQYVFAAKASRNLEVIERAAQITVYARDINATIAVVELWTEIDPGNLEAQQIAAAMYIKNGQVEMARRHFEMIINQGKQDENSFLLVSSVLSKESDKETALKVMSELAIAFPDNADAQFAHAQLAQVVGDLPTALTAVQAALKIRPKWIDAIILEGDILFHQDKKSIAYSNIQNHIKQDENNVELRNYYARRLIDDGKYTEALEQYEYLLDMNSDDTSIRRVIARLDYQLLNFDSATEHFIVLVELGKYVDESNFYLGNIAIQLEQVDQAIEFYTGVESGVYYMEAQIRIALLEASNGQLKEALQRLHQITPEDIKTEVRLIRAEGDILAQQKRYQEAFDLYSETLAKMPDNIDLLYSRALIAEKIDRVDVTISDLRALLVVDPDNIQALNALGYTLIDKTDKLDEGMTYILQAHKQKPNDPSILDSVGWGYYRLGDYENALKYLQQAYDQTQDAEIAAHLGEVLWITGDETQALNIWQAAIQEAPSHKVLQDVIKRFTK